MKSIYWILILSVFLLVNSCGFHLKGLNTSDQYFAFDEIFISSSKNTDTIIVEEIKRSFIAQSIILLDVYVKDSVQLKLEDTDIIRTVTATDSNGQATSEILKYKQEFNMSYNGVLIGKSKAISLITLDLDPNNALFNDQEIQLKQETIQKEISTQILQTISGWHYPIKVDNKNIRKKNTDNKNTNNKSTDTLQKSKINP